MSDTTVPLHVKHPIDRDVEVDGDPFDQASPEMPLEWKLFIAILIFGPHLVEWGFGGLAGQIGRWIFRLTIFLAMAALWGGEYFQRGLVLDCRSTEGFWEKWGLVVVALCGILLEAQWVMNLGGGGRLYVFFVILAAKAVYHAWMSARARFFTTGIQYRIFYPWKKVLGAEWKLSKDPELLIAYQAWWAIHQVSLPIPAGYVHDLDRILAEYVPWYPGLPEEAKLHEEQAESDFRPRSSEVR